MRCIFTHQWVMGEAFDVKSFSPWRKCKRCGLVQRGAYDKERKDITWETLRERVYRKSQHGQIVRQPSSGFDQMAHTLGLRRSRKSDRLAPTKRPVRTKT